MSLPFNDTTNLKALVQMYEVECDFEPGYISGNTTRLKRFAADVNETMDEYFDLAIQASGKWQVGDSNHPGYSEIYTDLVAGQTDYAFTTDGDGNLILDIYRVFNRSIANGPYEEMTPVDRASDEGMQSFNDGEGTEGHSTRYDKADNAVFLEYAPPATIEDGLKLLINREGSYFSYDATSKKPGVPGLHHAYFYLKPALKHARIKGTNNFVKLSDAVTKMERKIEKHFGKRSKDETVVLRGEQIPYE